MNEVTASIREHFEAGGTIQSSMGMFDITKASAKHYWIEWVQARGEADKHHPEEKAEQIRKVLEARSGLGIYEVYGGHGYCTSVYEEFGEVTSRTLADGQDWTVTHAELAAKRTYDVVDLDGYGYPSRLIASGVFELLKDEGILILTVPVTGANFLNRITQAHLKMFFGTAKPTVGEIVRAVRAHALAYYRLAELVDAVRMDRIWRLVFSVRRTPATEIFGVRNRPGDQPMGLDVVVEPVYKVLTSTKSRPSDSGNNPILDLFGDEE